MLYQIYASQRTFAEPFAEIAQSLSRLYGNPYGIAGRLPMAGRISAGYALLHRFGKDYGKPEFNITQIKIDEQTVAISEQIQVTKPFCDLVRFKRFCDDEKKLTELKAQPAVLIIAPLSGHYPTLLRDTVRTMLQGHKVYITDWKNARDVALSEGDFHLDDYINYVQEFIRYLQAEHGQCHTLSVCQPTVPVLAAISLMASRGEQTPASMTMMGGPIDASQSPTAVTALADKKSIEWFESNLIYRVPASYAGAGRRVYPGFLQHTGFVAMNPSRHARSHYDYFQNLIKGDESSVESHQNFYDEYNAVLDMDANYYLETIKVVFQDFNLVKGNWDIKSESGKIERVIPQDITKTALFTIEGELDDISGIGQTKAAHDLCKSIPEENKKHSQIEKAGHYGIFSGSRWRTYVYPQIKEFIYKYHTAKAVDKMAKTKPNLA